MSRRQKEHRADIKYEERPLYGDIPLVAREFRDRRGQPYVIYDYDLKYTPKLPRGAVRGDVRKQNLCFACHAPKYFYVDEEKICIQCGLRFMFAAEEQKFWYESLRFYGTSVAIRCPVCRRKQRTEKALVAQIALARSALKSDPDDAAALLIVAEAIVRYHQRTQRGNLDEAISSARRVRKLAPPVSEAVFWKAISHLQSGRREKARQAMEVFVRSPGRSKRHRDLLKEAKGHLADLKEGEHT
jgi:Probable zinc-ribbon domain